MSIGFQTPEQGIATLAVIGISVALFIRFVRWLMAGPASPDPWDATITAEIDSGKIAPVCHRCLLPHDEVAHFCPHCGAAVGDYNNVLPFVNVFSEGEVFRNGTTLHLRPSFVVLAGYIILPIAAAVAMAMTTGVVLSVLFIWFFIAYWILLLQNLFERRDEQAPPSANEASSGSA